MKRKMTAAIVFALVTCTFSTTWAGRPDKFKDWFGHFAAGYSVPQSDLGDQLDGGFYVDGGATFWPDSSPVGLDIDLSYSSYDLKSSVISEINDDFEDDN